MFLKINLLNSTESEMLTYYFKVKIQSRLIRKKFIIFPVRFLQKPMQFA